MKYFSELVYQSLARAKESSLSVLGITNPHLRQHLQDRMQQDCGQNESMMASPLFEHTFGWTEADKTMHELVADKLLSPAVLASLDKDKITDMEGVEVENRYQFKGKFKPYTHQLKSWNTLLAEEPKSVVVTSGTGSGKTECFMVPVLEDLYRETQKVGEPLSGVRAIFLYPLNALINSQRERLHAWTQDFGGNIRFCLYNGNTEEKANKVKARQAKVPNEILSRELMRERPAPILVTNGTMLEYMLVRNVDAPIINKSRQEKSLRWIVLDEAHTYVGSQAAELSMQLRRVLHAFGVEAKDVRFVATSATIADENAEAQLQNYLAGLAGVPNDHVVVIGGQRNVPKVEFNLQDSLSLDEMLSIPADKAPGEKQFDPEVSQARYEALQQSSVAKVIRDSFVNVDKPLKLSDLIDKLKQEFPAESFSQSETLSWLDLLTGTKENSASEAFLKVRAHFFQRMMNGIWSCIDPDCSCKQNSALQSNWPFGMVYSKQVGKCECGSPVLEVGFCNDCNEPHLLACDKNGYISQRDTEVSDEFSLLLDLDDDIEQESENTVKKRKNFSTLITLRASADKNEIYEAIDINSTTGKLGDLNNTIRLYSLYDRDENSEYQSGCCGYKGTAYNKPLRRAILGAPFYVANVVPTVLEFCPDPKVDKATGLGPQSLPGRGRKLITFTDSRQGTARMSVKMQQEAEKNKLRGLVFRILLDQQKKADFQSGAVDIEKINKLRTEIGQLEAVVDRAGIISSMLEDKKNELSKLEVNAEETKFTSISWSEMINSLIDKEDINQHILSYNKYANQEVFGSETGKIKVADMLLTREFIRRPKIYHNLETQGLVKVDYPNIASITEVPHMWESHKLTLIDWHHFLKISMDFFVRDNSFFKLDDDWRQWIGFKFSHKFLISPQSEDINDARTKKWSLVSLQNANRLGKLLSLGANLPLDVKSNIDIVNSWLEKAWQQLTTSKYSLLSSDNGKFYLDRRNINFSFFDKGYICSSTNKILDTTFKSITPYLPQKVKCSEINRFICRKVDLPKIWDLPDLTGDFNQDLNNARNFIRDEQVVNILREKNLWTDINDRVLEGGFYYRTAEHSAQQSAKRLSNYERDFKIGKVNVLNCSTTMEMGVDIGGISAVVMNNVPPHPANYLQRAGRAGRSKESRAISYTLCKNNPHDNEVFSEPSWPFITAIPAPQISLDSKRLVQRHVNSLLLSIFLREVVGTTKQEKTNLNLEWFYGEQATGASTCQKFMAWVVSNNHKLEVTLKKVLKGTGLAKIPACNIIDKTKCEIEKLSNQWLKQYKELKIAESNATSDSAYEYKVKIELTRHTNEYLLKELAAKAFLPGYGFPTDIVTLSNKNIVDFKREKEGKNKKEKFREDNISQLREMPTRNLAVAIREYAPGAEIVLDGRVFRSAGVALNWQKLSGDAREGQKFDVAWRCESCGHSGLKTNTTIVEDWSCSSCGTRIRSEWKKTVLEPTGFVTDFFTAPSNDITAQRYIAVQPAWISINADSISLPNPSLGYMVYGTESTIFQHSSGTNDHGYAVCMQCGKAESMIGDGEYPKELSPTSQHKPITSTPKSRDKDGYEPEYCDGSATVHGNVHLGCSSLTDAFEIILRNPISGEYIDPRHQDSETVALTLAVALRNALAAKLGISTSELGYSVRKTRVLDTNNQAMVVQIYDVVSGGAGFSISAASHIEDLLKAVLANLNCKSSCDSACSSCLLDSNTRHDANQLNRNIAKEWIGEHFKHFIGLESKYHFIDGAKFCYESILEAISQQINKGANNIKIWMGHNTNEWDLNSRTVQMLAFQMLSVHNINLTFILPDKEFSDAEYISLLRLKDLGVNFMHSRVNLGNGVLAAQATFTNQKTYTLACSNNDAINPNQNWLLPNTENMVVYSETFSEVETYPVDFSKWLNVEGSKIAKVELGVELDGQINGFGSRFWDYLADNFEPLANDLKSNKVSRVGYTDRYLQSPWYIILLGELIRSLPNNGDITFELNTLFNDKKYPGKFIHDDWSDSSDMSKVISTWFDKGASTPCYLDIFENRDEITHRREMLLQFENGNEYTISLDQGMGYWNHYLGKNKHWFEFDVPNNQLIQMLEIWENGSLKTKYDWKTVIYVVKQN
ncbi:DEAD/DEAH box helicase [Pseudoalteromonas sp. JC3]|uniref:DEAD/DEAH box helicase n=1 Tax=Pseudoalteromonas sp. JC3 TaxID=2810196 RepID=UPI0019CFC874|nr:DEAD/DEAH box helicase [Pseudoalteromonas sp. JC3]MBR8842152.1 DEAD/DEAH box helicase [Pseudoalteromonas sp. JC3]WJE09818.1 DEAD/DEAH box helicase [Pseudoalteromonas sp. JC3]